MKEVGIHQKNTIVNILTTSFKENKSVNYIIQQGGKKRLEHLMSYSFEICYKYGKVYLSDDEKGCALILFPDKKQFSLWSIFQDIKLVILAVGIVNVQKALNRESLIKKKQYKGSIYYIWFIGVLLEAQGKGIGSSLFNELLTEAKSLNRTVCLETSTVKNIPWYQKFGLKIYDELELSYKLYFLKNSLK